jgi:hypothetical protein
MKSFTVKDFIAYNNPCFSCGEHINIRFRTVSKISYVAGLIKPLIKIDSTTVDLVTKYRNILQLQINNKTNKILSNDIRSLKEFLFDNNIQLISNCSKCNTSITSSYLIFNFDKWYIEPTTISLEDLIICENNKHYSIISSFMDDESIIYCAKNGGDIVLSFKSKLLPLYTLKTKENMLNKIKTYLVFS